MHTLVIRVQCAACTYCVCAPFTSRRWQWFDTLLHVTSNNEYFPLLSFSPSVCFICQFIYVLVQLKTFLSFVFVFVLHFTWSPLIHTTIKIMLHVFHSFVHLFLSLSILRTPITAIDFCTISQWKISWQTIVYGWYDAIFGKHDLISVIYLASMHNCQYCFVVLVVFRFNFLPLLLSPQFLWFLS